MNSKGQQCSTRTRSSSKIMFTDKPYKLKTVQHVPFTGIEISLKHWLSLQANERFLPMIIGENFLNLHRILILLTVLKGTRQRSAFQDNFKKGLRTRLSGFISTISKNHF